MKNRDSSPSLIVMTLGETKESVGAPVGGAAWKFKWSNRGDYITNPNNESL